MANGIENYEKALRNLPTSQLVEVRKRRLAAQRPINERERIIQDEIIQRKKQLGIIQKPLSNQQLKVIPQQKVIKRVIEGKPKQPAIKIPRGSLGQLLILSGAVPLKRDITPKKTLSLLDDKPQVRNNIFFK